MNSLSLGYDHDVATVFALMIDADFLRRRREAVGELDVVVDVKENAGAFEVTISRDIETDIPSFAKKVFNPKNRVVDVTTWKIEGESRVGVYHAKVGSRIEITGNVSLRPRAGGCEYSESFTPSVRVALIGKRLETFVAREIVQGIRADHGFTRSELRART